MLRTARVDGRGNNEHPWHHIRGGATVSKPKWKGHPIIRQIVDRRNVGESHLSVTRYALSRFKGGRKAFLQFSRTDRRGIIREIIRVHTENRREYAFVMGGRPWVSKSGRWGDYAAGR